MHDPSALRVAFVNHSGFATNSGYHIAGYAWGLWRRGYDVRVYADGDPATADLPPGVAVDAGPLHRGEAVSIPTVEDGRRTIVHGWTPRERVRKAVQRLTGGVSPYFVHLEDHEEIVTSTIMGVPWPQLGALSEDTLDRLVPKSLSHPVHYRRFLEQAAGITVIVDELRDLAPPGVAVTTLEPGIDTDVFQPSLDAAGREALRQRLGLTPESIIVFHPGAMHAANHDDLLALYAAIGMLRRAQVDVALVRTGSGNPPLEHCDAADVRNLGFVPRDLLIQLLDLADICVQPGGPTAFNRHRLPSKLPEFLAMGRATVTSCANLGARLTDGEQALLLRTGGARELASAIRRLATDPDLRQEMGRKARAFAQDALRWSDKIDILEGAYRRLSLSDPIPTI